MGLFGSITSLFGGGSVKKGFTKAANAQQDSSNTQIANLDSALQEILAGYKPYTDLGGSAAGAFADLLGLGGTTASAGSADWNGYLAANPDVLAEYNANVDKSQFPTAQSYAQWHSANYGNAEGRAVPMSGATEAVSAADAQQGAIDALKASPLYQSLYRNGEEAVLANASATGGLRGGNTTTSLANFGADTLSSVIQQQLANYGSAIGAGLGANNSTTNANLSVTGAQNDATQTATNALIQKYLGKAGVNSQNWANLGSSLDDAVSLKSIGKFAGSLF